MKKIYLLCLFHFALSQFPTDLYQNDISDPFYFEVIQDTEVLLSINCSANTNWSVHESESVTLVVAIDGNWDNYNQDIVLFSGETPHNYYVTIGPMLQGEHYIEFKFDYNKSTPGANYAHIETIELVDSQTLDIDYDAILYSPIMYGRDLLSWNESTYTDIPLIMWHDIFTVGNNKHIKYSIIFSNEDSRIGVGLADLMYSYGRTTDIEWIYEVILSNEGDILSEIFQGASHITTNFEGEKVGLHPILKNATLNCNFSDTGTSDYKFFPSPLNTIESNLSRETLMDQNPWTYRIMGEELINENRYENEANPESVEISDVRNYIYIEYTGNTNNEAELDLAIKLYDSCKPFIHDHTYEEFQINYSSGLDRTSIELPDNFNSDYIKSIGFLSNANNNYNINITEISKLFYLDENYNIINIPVNFSAFQLNNNEPNKWLTINENLLDIDCLGITNGAAECDECNMCDGNDIELDSCGICFGNNLDLDCNNICFGGSILDECGICNGDNSSCSGCTDVNANNYDVSAIFYDGSCNYSDNLFLVPNEYSTIQNAIYFSSNGDSILVGEGVYNENINFLEKSITVKSLYNNNTPVSNFVINGVDSISTVTINNSFNNSNFMGFTISNGYGTGVSFEDFISLAADTNALDSLLNQVIRGGGISVINSNPHIKDVHVTNNVSRNFGAGIALINSDAIIESSNISNNTVLEGDALGGGGIAVNGGSPNLIDLNISNNFVGQNIYQLNGGGGILCAFSSEGNSLTLNIENSIISNNTANIGAGIGALSGDIRLNRTLISNNTGDYGSAISMGEPLGLAVSEINMNIINSTIVNNNGLMTIGLINTAYLNMLNTIIWDNEGSFEITNMPNNDQLNTNIAYSLSQNELNGEGNILVNPLFIDSDNYSLQDNSPCIDTGISFFEFDEDNIIDIAQNSFFGNSPDIGKYEFIPNLNSNNTDKNMIVDFFPNPFNPSININYTLSEQSNVMINAYNINGQLIDEIANNIYQPGKYSLIWNATDFSSGTYFVKLTTDKTSIIKKIVLIK
jgi:hypothetical protein